MFYRTVLVCFLASFLSSSLSLADQLQQASSEPKGWIQQESRWRVFASGLAGYGASTGAEFTKAPGGDQYLLSGVLTYQMPRWVHDLGLGWMSSNLRTKREDGATVSIKTRAAMAEYGFRTRLGQRWSVGPMLNVAFGTDTSFSPTVGNALATPFIGGRVVYEMPISIFPVRFVGQMTTDLGLAERRVLFALAGIQIGLPVGIPSKTQSIQLSQSSVSRVDQAVVISLDAKLLHFYTKSSKVNAEAKKFLSQVAQELKDTQWSQVMIVGHSDQRGAVAMNDALSKKRAQSVAALLLQNGVDAQKVIREGLGVSQLLDRQNNRLAWAKNRRVELKIEGVQNPDRLVARLQTFEDSLRDKVWEKNQK